MRFSLVRLCEKTLLMRHGAARARALADKIISLKCTRKAWSTHRKTPLVSSPSLAVLHRRYTHARASAIFDAAGGDGHARAAHSVLYSSSRLRVYNVRADG